MVCFIRDYAWWLSWNVNLYHDTENHKDTRQSHGPGHRPHSRRLYRRRDRGGFKSHLPVSPPPRALLLRPHYKETRFIRILLPEPTKWEGVLASAQREGPVSRRALLPGKGLTGWLCGARRAQSARGLRRAGLAHRPLPLAITLSSGAPASTWGADRKGREPNRPLTF